MVTISLPTQPQARVKIVDIFRGFALFGVLMGNFNGFVMNDVPEEIKKNLLGPADLILDSLHSIFIEHKFMTLFSILFGYGFGVIIDRVSGKGLNTSSFFLRRMFWLFVIGCIHLAFWWGDILHFYAEAGIFLLFFRKMSDRKILICSLVSMFIAPFLVRLLQVNFVKWPDFNAITRLYYQTMKFGSLSDVAKMNFSNYPKIWLATLVDFRDLFETLGRFLFGYYILRRQILVRLDLFEPLINKTRKFSLLGTLAFIGVWLLEKYQVLPERSLIWFLPFRMGTFFMTLFYASSLALLYVHSKFSLLMNAFSDLGRMALTNYLMQTLVYIIIFYRIGFAMLGEWTLVPVWISAFVMYFLQILFSKWWLSRFIYGPVEWIWRQLTYRKRLQIRKTAASGGLY